LELDRAQDEPRLGTAILGLGSNLGDRVRYLERALERLRRQIAIERVSSIYETQPVDVQNQPWFLNLVCVGLTQLKPRALLEFILEIESSLGRVRVEPSGPRTVDIDILAYNARVVDEADLTIPHPRLAERAFVLVPLAEIWPDWRHPLLGKSARELARELAGEEVRVYADPPPRAGGAPFL
jgi:2-amino-4-hydroxy-6-hydroxymethyldihydropteridine diphosphokinase